jgi:nicotinate dehydrogenase subunit A
VMAATALLKSNPQPSETQIREALATHLCRCGTHTRIVKAVQRAARQTA